MNETAGASPRRPLYAPGPRPCPCGGAGFRDQAPKLMRPEAHAKKIRTHRTYIEFMPIKENTVNTKFRLWASRIVAGVVAPAALAVGLTAASASAQPSAATHVTSSTQPAIANHPWHIYRVYYNYGPCYNQYYWFTHHHYYSYYRYYNSFYYGGHHYYHVWVLYYYYY
jgi:hypothetical protein